MSVIDELRDMRKRWNMTQYDVAQLVSVSTDHIKGVEDKRHTPSVDVLEKWADALGCNIKLEFRK